MNVKGTTTTVHEETMTVSRPLLQKNEERQDHSSVSEEHWSDRLRQNSTMVRKTNSYWRECLRVKNRVRDLHTTSTVDKFLHDPTRGDIRLKAIFQLIGFLAEAAKLIANGRNMRVIWETLVENRNTRLCWQMKIRLLNVNRRLRIRTTRRRW